MKSTNVLLTGGLGYIGSHTAIFLIDAGLNVILLDNLSNSVESTVLRLEVLASKKINFVKGDVRDTEFISSIIRKYSIDSIIHFAGLKSVEESFLDPLKYFDNNVLGTISVLKAMKINKIKKIVFSSSATIYGEPEYLPCDENHPTKAISPYGLSKMQTEEILKTVASSDASFSSISLRYFNPVGAHYSGLIGEVSGDNPSNLVPYVAKVASGKLPIVHVFGNDYATTDGTCIRDYIHVVDLAKAHFFALNFVDQNKGWQSINIGTGRGYSVMDVINTFSKITKKQIPFDVTPRRSGDISVSYADITKAKIFLHWRAEKNLEEMVKSAWQWEIAEKI